MNSNTDTLYQLDGFVNLKKAIPFGLQHVLAMFVSNITPIIILANAMNLGKMTANLIQNAMIIAAIGTLIQLYPIWKIGARLPIVMGISFTFLSLSIGVSQHWGMETLIGAIIIGGIVEGVLGLFAKYWVRFISPIVAAAVVTGIGFSLLPIGANSFAGGVGSADFGSLNNWIVGSVTLVLCIGLTVFTRGYIRTLAVLSSLIVGFLVALCMGMVNLSSLNNVAIISLPHFMPFRPVFHLGPICSFIAIFMVSATETIGDTSALAATALGRQATGEEFAGALACDGFISSFSGLLGCTPITSFSQNVGLASMTKIVNRFAVACGAIIMLIAGLVPALGCILASIPQCVLGGCSIMMFGAIMYAGFNMIAKCGFSARNLTILSVSLSVGLGFTSAPHIFDIFPEVFRQVFAENCVAVIFLLALLLDIVIPKH